MPIKVNIPAKKPAAAKVQINIKKQVASKAKPKTVKKKVNRGKTLWLRKCYCCSNQYQPKRKTQKYCSKSCAGKQAPNTQQAIQKQIQKQVMDFDRVATELKPFLQHGASLSYSCNAIGQNVNTVNKWLNIDLENLPVNYEPIRERITNFQRSIALAKEFVNFAATKVIQNKIFEDKDDYNARWWLEKRNPDFIPKQKQNIDTTNKVKIIWGLEKSPYVNPENLPT